MAFGFAAFAAASPAPAQQVARDARCLLVSGVFATSANDEKAKQVANLTRSFFLGRLDSRLSPAQIGAAFAAERRNITQATLAATMNACAQYVGSRTVAVQTATQRSSSQKR